MDDNSSDGRGHDTLTLGKITTDAHESHEITMLQIFLCSQSLRLVIDTWTIYIWQFQTFVQSLTLILIHSLKLEEIVTQFFGW